MPLISGAIAVVSAVSAFVGSLGVIGGGLLKTVMGLGLSYAAQALAGKPKEQSPAFRVHGQIRSEGVVPRSYMSGPGMTAGSLVYTNTWTNISTPNAFFVKVIALRDLPSKGLLRVMINGEWVTLDDTPDEDGRGYPVLQYRKGGKDYQWIKFYDGTQTEADAYLVAKFGSHPLYPYESTRVGYGVAYAICTSRLNDKLFSGFPEFKFELAGTKWYDPSQDDTVGGEGDQRWDTPSTWGGDGDALPAVQLYNLCRGITYGGEWFYGLQGVAAAQLPNAAWVAAIEKCRAEIEGPNGNEPQYRCGGEVLVSTRIAETVEGLLTACNGKLAEIGGVYKPIIGEPGEAVGSFTDDDIISTAGQTFTPFHGLADTINGIAGKYPEPEEGWNVKAAPTLYNEDYEEEDGNRRLLADVDYSMVPYKGQVQRLMKSALAEARRARQHTLTLPPKFWKYEPGDILEWTSARNGYVEKLFRIDGMTDLANLDVIVSLTEVDPADYDWDQEADYTPPVDGPVGIARPDPQPMTGWQAFPDYLQDANEEKRRPSIRVEFASGLDDVRAVHVQVRVKANQKLIYTGEEPYEDLPEVSEGVAGVILNGEFASQTEYEVRGRFVPYSDRDTEWSDWLTVETPFVPEVSLPDQVYRLLQKVEEIGGQFRGLERLIEQNAGASAIDQATLEEFRGIINMGLGSVYEQNKAAAELAMQTATDAQSALARIFLGADAQSGRINAQAALNIVAYAATDEYLSRILLQALVADGDQSAIAALELAVVPTNQGPKGVAVLGADETWLRVGNALIPASGLQRGDEAKEVFVEDGEITVDLRTKHKCYVCFLDDDAEIQFPIGGYVGQDFTLIVRNQGSYELTYNTAFCIVGDTLQQPVASPAVWNDYTAKILSLDPPVMSLKLNLSGATSSGTETMFSISPALPTGETAWNLDTMGPLIIDGSLVSTVSYTLTPLGERLDCLMEIWGPGGTSGSGNDFGISTDIASPDHGTPTIFSGPGIATMTAGAGQSSESRKNGNSPPPSATTEGGVSTGGDTNTNGSSGGNSRENSNWWAGRGADAPDGGAEIPRVSYLSGSAANTPIAGNTPGGGARGHAAYSSPHQQIRAIGGGASGAKCQTQFDFTNPLVEGVGYTLQLGRPGLVVSSTRPGAPGGKSRVRITKL